MGMCKVGEELLCLSISELAYTLLVVFSFLNFFCHLYFLLNSKILNDFLFGDVGCQDGTYGEDCSQICNCTGQNFICHHLTGKCVCKPGHKGKHCSRGQFSWVFLKICKIIYMYRYISVYNNIYMHTKILLSNIPVCCTRISVSKFSSPA